MGNSSRLVAAVLLAAGLTLVACSDDPESVTVDPVDGFCRAIADVSAALRDLSDGTDPAAGLQTAAAHLDGIPPGALRDQATVVHRRLAVVARDGVGPVPGAELPELRSALSDVSSECASRGQPAGLLEGFSAA